MRKGLDRFDYFMVGATVINVALLACVVYAAVHFISKYW